MTTFRRAADNALLGGSSGDTPWMAAFELEVFRAVSNFNCFAASGFHVFYMIGLRSSLSKR
jgi:hypothetical protein